MWRCWAFRECNAAEVFVHVQHEIQSFLLVTFRADGSSSAEHIPPSGVALQYNLPECVTPMFLYMLIFMAYHSSRWIPRNQRLKFQIVNAVFTALVLVPQFYVMGRPKSSRYCRQPLLNNLSASIALSFIASGKSHHIRHISKTHALHTTSKKRINIDITSTLSIGFSVIFTLIDPVPQSLWASYHVFGLLTCGQGLCTTILTLTAAACAKTTPELYYISLILTVASILSTGFFMVRGTLWLTNRKHAPEPSRNNEQ
ncbi:uncharacterized protein LOC116051265 isoform X1 [Sander lucioperca]|uniref:uncharacterized protein LOC116051265 isoform X1 n=1 Tax=Sander lucioperca TaxID=283035 RepID=UPI00125DC9F5|nr:uncharacterized protein LOC116051265 isoform X1 [Sander lucioperca]